MFIPFWIFGLHKELYSLLPSSSMNLKNVLNLIETPYDLHRCLKHACSCVIIFDEKRLLTCVDAKENVMAIISTSRIFFFCFCGSHIEIVKYNHGQVR
jgi:hypothetical protein